MDHGSGREIGISGRKGKVAPHRSPFTHIQVRAQSSHVTRNRTARIHVHFPEHHRNIAPYVPMDVNIAKHAGNVARGVPFCDCDIAAEGGAVIRRSGVGGQGGGKNNCNSEKQSAHKNLVEQV